MAGPIRIVRQGISGEVMDTIVELAYETLQRRAMHRRAGRLLPDLPSEDQVRQLLRSYRDQRGLQDYELSEHKAT